MYYPFFVKTYGVSNFWSIVQYVGKDIVDITSNSNFLIVVPHPESVLSLENSLWEWLPVNTNETSDISKTSRTFLITDSAKTSPISGTPPITKIDFYGIISSKLKIVASAHFGLNSTPVFLEIFSCRFTRFSSISIDIDSNPDVLPQ